MALRSNNKGGSPAPGRSSDSVDRINDTVRRFIISQDLIPENTLVLAAVSGGQDSMAMLSVLQKLSGELGFRLSVGHFDHQLRSSSKEDRSIVEKYAKSCALEAFFGSADVRAAATQDKEPLEEAGRKARYTFLFRVADEIGADNIATGHTKSDQVETIIMRFLRGSGFRGLAGIPVRRGKLIRPLLQLERKETRFYCEANRIPFVLDPSNSDTQFLRNKIRLELLPFLRKIDPAVENNILRVSDNAQEILAATRQRIQLLDPFIGQTNENEWLLDVGKLTGLDETALVILFGDLFAEKMHLDMDFTRFHYEKLIRLVMDTTASGKKLSLPGLEARREYDSLIFTPHEAKIPLAQNRIEEIISVPGKFSIAGFLFETCFIEKTHLEGETFHSSSHTAYFAMDRVFPPMIIRSPVPGDRMQPFGMRGSKKLSDIFIDKKIPGRDRLKSLVLTDTKGILWLIGAATSERGRIEENTKKF